jgi:flagellar assembly factor FliW
MDNQKTEDEKLVIESRYGTIEVDPTTTIRFASGLLGFPQWHNYALVDLDNEKYAQFKLLQSIDEKDLSFIVLPINTENDLYDARDMESACKILEVNPTNLVILLLVCVRRKGDNVAVTVNLRAPLLIDSDQFMGTQHVLSDEKYPIRYELAST